MSETIKFIVQELNKPPFNKSYNLITFDAIETTQLLQNLTDILAAIDPKQKIDVREEPVDQTAIRIFSCLRVLKYRPPENTNMSQFRQGLVQGEKQVIYPIMEWLLQRRPDLQKRAYLARYLVKVEIPPDFMADEQIGDLFNQYEMLVDDFKEVHKTSEMLKNSGFSTTDIKKDIASMEEEKEQLIRRVDRLKRKVETNPQSGPMLTAARNLRLEQDKESEIQKQKYEQKNVLVQYEQRVHRLQQQIKGTKQASIGATPEGLLQKLDEETKVNKYMVADKLPREISARRNTVKDLQRVVAEPAMGQSDLNEINEKIRQTNAEINQLIEKRMMSGDPTDDKHSLFRQQAAIIARKKEAAAETLSDAREELARYESEADEKRNQCRQAGGDETVLKGDEFKRYVNKLRGKSTLFKKKRGELAEMRAESGVLQRTEELLKNKDEKINRTLSAVESKQGVSGYRETQEALENVSSMKGDLDQMKGRTLEDISFMVQQLTKKIAEKKSLLAPVIKELRPMRQKAQEITQEYEEKKSAYDTMSAGFESNRSKLEQEVRVLREEIMAEQSRYHYLKAMQDIIEQQQVRVADEMKAYVSHDPTERKKTFRETYTKKIQEQENLGKGLREKQKYVRENQSSNMQQMKMWKDFERLMECKMHCANQGRGGSGRRRVAGAGGAYDGGYGGAAGGYGGGAGGYGAPGYQDADEDRLVL